MRMVLPMLMYDLEEETRRVVLDVLGRIGRKTEIPVQLQLSTNSLNEMMLELRARRQVSLIVIGVPPQAQDQELLAIRLGRYAMQQNRDQYVVYGIRERSELEGMLPYLSRSAGVLLCPPQEQALLRVLTPVLEDYKRVYGQEDAGDGGFVSLRSEGRVYRVRVSEVCTVQAVNKEIEFRTLNQTFSVYGSMSTAERMLDGRFMRCHRSYLINREMIEYVDFKALTIHMMDGTEIPLARSYKESMRESMAAAAQA